jgi:hypothetical protein
VEEIAQEIFDILKGANYKLRLFTSAGQKTLNPEEATRFYAYDHDLMTTIRSENARIEILVQAGNDYDVSANSKLLAAIKNVAHKNLGEYTVRKFNKNITPKDFAHQSVVESKAFGKSYGSIKTSYIPSPNAKIIIKHSKRVDEEIRGSRSRNIHSIFIENPQGEKFKFPYAYVTGAKAMAMHVSEGGTPYDDKGKTILSLCEDLHDVSKFLKHIKSNNLINETNESVVCEIKEAAGLIRNIIRSLSTQKGYNSFNAQESKESNLSVDITEQFMYNMEESEDIVKSASTISRIISEKREKDSMQLELMQRLSDLVNDRDNLKLTIDPNDPEHPDNEDPIKYSGSLGPIARLSSMLSLFSSRTKNDEASNIFAELSTQIHNMDPKYIELVAKFVDYIERTAPKVASKQSVINIAESVMIDLRKKIS